MSRCAYVGRCLEGCDQVTAEGEKLCAAHAPLVDALDASAREMAEEIAKQPATYAKPKIWEPPNDNVSFSSTRNQRGPTSPVDHEAIAREQAELEAELGVS